MITCAQTCEGKPLISCVRDKLLSQTPYSVHRSFPNWAVDHTCLAEATSSGTSPHNLDNCPVMDRLHERNKIVHRIWGAVQIPDNALPYRYGAFIAHNGQSPVLLLRHRGKQRNVYSLYISHFAQEFLPVRIFVSFVTVHDLHDNLFAVSDDEEVDEIGYRLRIEGAGAAGDDQRVA